MSNQQWASVGLDNSLVPNRWEAIVWTDAGLIYGRFY